MQPTATASFPSTYTARVSDGSDEEILHAQLEELIKIQSEAVRVKNFYTYGVVLAAETKATGIAMPRGFDIDKILLDAGANRSLISLKAASALYLRRQLVKPKMLSVASGTEILLRQGVEFVIIIEGVRR